jgi:hypothetical protein
MSFDEVDEQEPEQEPPPTPPSATLALVFTTLKQKHAASMFRKHFAKKGLLASAHALCLHRAAKVIEPEVTALLKELTDK